MVGTRHGGVVKLNKFRNLAQDVVELQLWKKYEKKTNSGFALPCRKAGAAVIRSTWGKGGPETPPSGSPKGSLGARPAPAAGPAATVHHCSKPSDPDWVT